MIDGDDLHAPPPPGQLRPMKCILIGETEVGKTSLLMRFKDGSFKTSTEPTIGVDFIR